jgi:hypothetical protein
MARRKPLEIEHVPVQDLEPHPWNYRKHPPDQLAHIVASIEQHGFYRNIVITKGNVILAGHGVVEAAKALELKTVPVYRVNIKPESPAAMKILIADNEIAKLGEVDDRALTNMLKLVRDAEVEAGGGLEGTGYDDMMLAALLMVSRGEGEVPDEETATQWVGMPEYEVTIKPVLTIQFQSEEHRVEFLERFDLMKLISQRQNQHWSMWWPPREGQDDKASVRWDNQSESAPEPAA